MSDLVPDMPPGPLDFYRNKASFDWKKMKIFIATEDVVKFENDLHEILRDHPEFQTASLPQTVDEQQRTAARQALAWANLDLNLSPKNKKRLAVAGRTIMLLSPSAGVKNGAAKGLFAGALRNQGTENHYKLREQAEKGEIIGGFCLTEIGHGSNIKKMGTTATFDKEKQQFILHTPNFESAKCWAGALGHTASYAIVYAQLYIDGVHHGLHTFVVPVRDPKTLLPHTGIIVGDMGEKVGLNGVDNGFVIFDNYHIPRENLLNKNAQVSPEGKFVRLKDSRSSQLAALGALSTGRVNVTSGSEGFGTKALTIAIRYAAVRKQFGPEGQEEVPILEYQSHQHRLLPYLAAAYAVRFFSLYLVETMYQFTVDSAAGQNKETLVELGMEMHAISSASKPVAAWLFRDAIQECREACGGHGYLKASGIGDVRNDHDAHCTFEGENHVLIQQTSNWLIKLWSQIEKGKSISTPLKSANFLSNALEILKNRYRASNVEEVCRPENIMDAHQWLVCYLLKETKNKLDTLIQKEGEFWAKNNTQVFYAKSLAITFIQHFFLQRMLTVISEASDANIRKVLLKLFSLYGLWSLEKFLSTLYEGGYAQGAQANRLIHEAILKLCRDIKDDSVSLIDAIAPPDFIVNSVLGASDGQVYHRLQASFLQSPYSMSRPKWWQEVANWKANLRNKL